ncbi:s-adenosylmethionine-dependent methyltransferase-like protein [Ophiostoma piceae UAMH 11346]|uniref:protein-histidine N-methyltransferase n=1 Tax=Ophiostoma piceae (strain UAMH 11346) TaxID=1262450 RepID=S3D456_OPHP1|nr:s-adenosylmethionine-dependent methyltransferase-like protein [Ophiostoma piceae UAMH 11346]
MSFSFSFSGDDIEDDGTVGTTPIAPVAPTATEASATPAASAFPVQGKPQLPPQRHDLKEMLAQLPSKVAYSLLDVALDKTNAEASQSSLAPRKGPYRLSLPRRELWDVKVQLMAEEGDDDDEKNSGVEGHELAPGLGTHDVKTGIYEGGFKSWESSVDLVKVLLQPPPDASSATPQPSPVAASVLQKDTPSHVIELGCGTALPSLALFHWASATASLRKNHLAITVADYNPSVLFLVTLPNFILAWALQQLDTSPLLQQAIAIDEEGDDHGELDLTDEVKEAFCSFLESSNISLSFLSGGWSPEFIELLYANPAGSSTDVNTLVLGAETIYSPFALESFSVTLMSILRRSEKSESGSSPVATGIVGAKKLYFGVGGSLDDFVLRMRDSGAKVTEIHEEADGVRRGVVQCVL